MKNVDFFECLVAQKAELILNGLTEEERACALRVARSIAEFEESMLEDMPANMRDVILRLISLGNYISVEKDKAHIQGVVEHGQN